MVSRRFFLFMVLSTLLFVKTSSARADVSGSEKSKMDCKWFLTLYGGLSAQDYLWHIFALRAHFPDDTYVAGGALAREIFRYKQLVSLELEGQVAKHFGEKASQWEFVGVLIGRWHPFPWDKYVDTSFALGDGISYYTKVPELETEDEDDSQRLLNYLLFELIFGLPKYPRWDLAIRVHHRSSIFNSVGDGGSNYLCGGIKLAF